MGMEMLKSYNSHNLKEVQKQISFFPPEATLSYSTKLAGGIDTEIIKWISGTK
jgi:hypothetical protein